MYSSGLYLCLMKRDLGKQRGFSVVELLVSIALFAVIVPTLSTALATLSALNNRARDLTLISIIAENKIESLRSIGYNSVPPGTVDFTSELPTEVAAPKSASYTVTQNSGYRTVDITVSYKDYRRTREVRYRSIISETGVGQ
jgi:prepilin-type N-terminal cleavage/methylation domain-containing protein